VATADSVLDYADSLLDNDYVQDRLREAGAKLRSAKQRAAKRRVDVTRDEKLRAQLRDAALALNEAGSAFHSGRTKPKPRWGRRALTIAGLTVVAGAVALAASDELRASLFGDEAQETTPSATETGEAPVAVA
jgi:hypothetical protein